MGRPTWATKEQAAFLDTFIPGLENAKKTHSLQVEYSRIAREFLRKWPAVVALAGDKSASDSEESAGGGSESAGVGRKPAQTHEQLLALAEGRRKQQINDWYKNRHKAGAQAQPKMLLDLTGKATRRKLTPYQLHQAYSIKYFRPTDSPLRKEVADLWNRRDEPDVADILTPFMKTDFAVNRLNFHNAIMRWKCSLLTQEEIQTLEDWIAESLHTKEEGIAKPWTVGEGEDELSEENEYIQRAIDSLPATMEKALEQVERSTGMKAIMLIGGPTPVATGDMTTHVYETGRSRVTGLRFSQGWEGFEGFHDEFVNWLRSVYSEAEIARRKGSPTASNPTPTLTTTPERSIPSDPAKEKHPTPTASSLSPSSPEEPLSAVNQTANDPADPPSRPGQTPPETPQPSSPKSPTQDGPHTPLSPPLVTSPPLLSPGGANEDGQQSPSVSPLLTNSSDQPTGESGSFETGCGGSLRVPPPVGTLTFGGTSPFLTTGVIGYLQTIPAGQRWVDMVNSYLRLEEFPVAKGAPMRLSTTSRPDEVSTWMKTRSYKPEQIPFVPDIGSYHKKWTAWWTSCQPAWRQRNGWPLPRDGENIANWGIKTGARGQNGLFLVVISTAWWASSIQSEDDWAEFDEAVEDIQWVISRVIDSLKALPAPAPPAPPTGSKAPQESVPVPGAAWMTRANGKRQPKPSRRLLEGGL